MVQPAEHSVPVTTANPLRRFGRLALVHVAPDALCRGSEIMAAFRRRDSPLGAGLHRHGLQLLPLCRARKADDLRRR